MSIGIRSYHLSNWFEFELLSGYVNDNAIELPVCVPTSTQLVIMTYDPAAVTLLVVKSVFWGQIILIGPRL